MELLKRSARGVKLTEAGTRLFEHASRGLDILQEGHDAVVSDQAHVKGKLRLSVPPSFSPWWPLITELPPFIVKDAIERGLLVDYPLPPGLRKRRAGARAGLAGR